MNHVLATGFFQASDVWLRHGAFHSFGHRPTVCYDTIPDKCFSQIQEGLDLPPSVRYSLNRLFYTILIWNDIRNREGGVRGFKQSTFKTTDR